MCTNTNKAGLCMCIGVYTALAVYCRIYCGVSADHSHTLASDHTVMTCATYRSQHPVSYSAESCVTGSGVCSPLYTYSTTVPGHGHCVLKWIRMMAGRKECIRPFVKFHGETPAYNSSTGSVGLAYQYFCYIALNCNSSCQSYRNLTYRTLVLNCCYLVMCASQHIGYGLLKFRDRYVFAVHLVYALLRGRPVVVLGKTERYVVMVTLCVCVCVCVCVRTRVCVCVCVRVYIGGSIHMASPVVWIRQVSGACLDLFQSESDPLSLL